MIQQGFLVISDITGYSTYLNSSELEHARDSLTDLLNLLIKYTRSPLIISKLEGDAVFSYAPKGGFNQGQTLLEMMETTYMAFRKALDLMVRNTSCNCRACRNLPNLDLKFFIHYGAYSIQQLGDFQELVGNDVILVHRMLKNKITEGTGLKAYAAYCQAVVDVLKMEEMVGNMIQHRETLADVGEVSLYIQDMSGVWEKRKDEVRIIVKPEEAIYSFEKIFNIPQPVLWDYLTNPQYRTLLYPSEYQTTVGLNDGRINTGTAYVCAHGNSENIHMVLDWQAFEQYTANQTLFGDASHNVTTLLVPVEQGTILKIYYGKTQGSIFYRPWMDVVMKYFAGLFLLKPIGNLQKQIDQDIMDENTVVYPRIEFGNELATKAAAESLAEYAAPGG